MPDYRTSACKGCGCPIIWVQVACSSCQGRSGGCARCQQRGVVRVPLDARAPVFTIRTDPDSGDAESLPFAELAKGSERRVFVSHFATCPKAGQYSRGARKEPS